MLKTFSLVAVLIGALVLPISAFAADEGAPAAAAVSQGHYQLKVAGMT